MKERFEKAKTFVKNHAEELVVGLLATLAVGTAYGLVRSAQNDVETIIDDDPTD